MITFSTQLLGITLIDPMTFITDALITISCAIFAKKYKQNCFSETDSNWLYFFVILGISTLIGGFAHLLFHYTGKPLLITAWLTSGISVFFIERTAIKLVTNEICRNILHKIIIFKLILFVISVLVFGEFIYVKIHSILGMVGIFTSIHAYRFYKFRYKESSYMLLGIFVSALSSLAHSFKLSINEIWFNYNDTSHIILIIGIYMFFLGSFRTHNEDKQLSVV